MVKTTRFWFLTACILSFRARKRFIASRFSLFASKRSTSSMILELYESFSDYFALLALLRLDLFPSFVFPLRYPSTALLAIFFIYHLNLLIKTHECRSP
jgi:hypothetical protein